MLSRIGHTRKNLLLGVFPLAIFAGQDSLSYDIARMGSHPLLLTLAGQFDREEVMSYFNLVFAIGSILGPTLLGIALWLSLLSGF